MHRRAVRFARLAALTAIPLATIWAHPTPPVSRSGAPGDQTCASCHGPAGSGGIVVTSTSGMTNYTPGASKHFTVTVTGTGGAAGFEITARPASNLTGGVAGKFVAGTTTEVLCKVGTSCAAGNPQYLRSIDATATPAKFDFDWTAPAGTENVTLYVGAAVGYDGNSYAATYTLTAGGGGTSPTLTVAPASLSYSYQVGGSAPPTQTLAISGATSTYTVAASGGAWLSVTPASGGTSGSASVSVNTAGLAAGSYTGSVTITAPGSTASPKTVPVTLNVTATAPALTVSPASLAFSYQIGGTAPAAQTLAISGAASTYTVAASGGAWLSVTPASGGTSGSASVSVNTAGLAAGSYIGSVAIAAAGSTGNPRTVPVTLNVTAAAPALTVSPASLAFTYQIGGTAPAAQTLAISGVASTYTVAASSGAWLSVTPASGGTSGSASVAVNTTGLAAGSFSGTLTITAAGSTGSPKTVAVTLNVTPAPSGLTVSPASLAFTSQIGGTAPATQTLAIGGVATTYAVAASGGAWLSVSPASGGKSGSASVAVNTAGLAAGSFNGLVTITAAGSTGSPKTVPVTLNVTPAPSSLTVSPASLAFAYQIGGPAPAAQTLAISGVATTYTVAASGGAWLAVSPASGGTSGSASVSVSTAGLAAGSYSGLVTITAAGSTGSPKTVAVTLNVTAAPALTVSPASFSFAYQIGGAAPAAQALSIGGVSATYTAAASGGAWLGVTPTSGGTSGSASVSVNTAGLAAGSYSGTITITAAGSTGSPKTLPVTLSITPAAPTLTVSPASFSFAYRIGGTMPPAQALSISGAATTYTVEASGGSWLSVTPASGGTSGSASISVNPAGLGAGSYSGSLTVTAASSTGSTATVAVNLTVTDPSPSLQVAPAALSFTCATGNTAPLPYVLQVSSSSETLGYTAAVSGGNWLSVAPASGDTPGAIFVSVNPAGLSIGTYKASVTIRSSTSASNTSVPVTLAVGGPASSCSVPTGH